MGNLLSAFKSLLGNTERRILMVGLDAAGKTTILYKLKLGEQVTTIPTIGFNVESVQYKNINMTIWDVGGQEKIRPLWRHYYNDVDGIIFVVDSSDVDRLGEAAAEVQKLMLEDQLRNARILVFANKMDLPKACPANVLADRIFGKFDAAKNRTWWIQESNAKTGEGLYEGLDWLSRELAKVKK